jgi:hypothetical protein
VVGAARQKGNPGATARRSAFRLFRCRPVRSRSAAARAVRAIGLRAAPVPGGPCWLLGPTHPARLCLLGTDAPRFLTTAALAISLRQARNSGLRSSSAISSSSHSMSGRVLVRGSPTISTSVVAPPPHQPHTGKQPKGRRSCAHPDPVAHQLVAPCCASLGGRGAVQLGGQVAARYGDCSPQC